MCSDTKADPITYSISPPVGSAALNDLFAAAWPNHAPADFQPLLDHSLAYICAYSGAVLVGFVQLAWDGGIHAFLLNTTVHTSWQRRGIGHELVRQAAEVARERGLHWLHVDYEPRLAEFYRACDFRHTEAGLLRLAGPPDRTNE